jgi:AraC-like DNA-binding protein
MHKEGEIMHISPEPSVIFLAGGRYSAKQGQSFPPHHHPMWELVYYRTGSISAPVGDLITPPDTLHAEIADTSYSNFYVQLNAPKTIGWPVVAYDDSALRLSRLFDAITRELNGGREHSDLLLQGYAVELVVLLRRVGDYLLASPAEKLVSRAELMIEERLGTRLKVADIATELNCSKSSLRAHFTELRATTPRDYLQTVRQKRALGLIRSSDQTLETVARLCGYDSVSHLSRHIKKTTGVSPGRLRTNLEDIRNGNAESAARK